MLISPDTSAKLKVLNRWLLHFDIQLAMHTHVVMRFSGASVDKTYQIPLHVDTCILQICTA